MVRRKIDGSKAGYRSSMGREHLGGNKLRRRGERGKGRRGGRERREKRGSGGRRGEKEERRQGEKGGERERREKGGEERGGEERRRERGRERRRERGREEWGEVTKNCTASCIINHLAKNKQKQKHVTSERAGAEGSPMLLLPRLRVVRVVFLRRAFRIG